MEELPDSTPFPSTTSLASKEFPNGLSQRKKTLLNFQVRSHFRLLAL